MDSDIDGVDDPSQLGLLLQGGWMFVPDEWELYARYEWGDADGLSPELSVFTIGVNRYVEEDTFKFTFDVGYGLNEVGDFWSSSGAGWRTDRPGEDGQVVARTQIQLLF